MEAGARHASIKPGWEVAQVFALIPRSGSLQGKAAAPDTSHILAPPQKKTVFFIFFVGVGVEVIGMFAFV